MRGKEAPSSSGRWSHHPRRPTGSRQGPKTSASTRGSPRSKSRHGTPSPRCTACSSPPRRWTSPPASGWSRGCSCPQSRSTRRVAPGMAAPRSSGRWSRRPRRSTGSRQGPKTSASTRGSRRSKSTRGTQSPRCTGCSNPPQHWTSQPASSWSRGCSCRSWRKRCTEQTEERTGEIAVPSPSRRWSHRPRRPTGSRQGPKTSASTRGSHRSRSTRGTRSPHRTACSNPLQRWTSQPASSWSRGCSCRSRWNHCTDRTLP